MLIFKPKPGIKQRKWKICKFKNLYFAKRALVKARIHGATLRAILRATSVIRRGYTVATFRATLRPIFDQRLPSSHAMMFTSRNPGYEILVLTCSTVLRSSKVVSFSNAAALTLLVLEWGESLFHRHRFSLKLLIINIRSVNCTFVKPNINIYTETKRPFAALPSSTATPCCHASNIKADKNSE